MKKISILFSLVLLATSCVKQMEEPESAKIAGMWVVVEDNDFTNKYIKFEHGVIEVYESDHVAYYVADKSVWGSPEGGVKQLSSNRYSLVDGILHYGRNRQKMCVEGETMILGDRKYRLVENICPEYYSTINVSVPTRSLSFNGGGVEWSYNITQPVEGFALKAKGPDWVNDLSVTADKISFTVPETTTTRTGIITLSYPSAEDMKVSVTQRAAEINLDNTSVTLGYAASSSSFTYSIPDPQDGYTLEVEASHDWITDVKDNGSSISFSVKENNSGSSRTGKITLTYGEVSKEFTVTQGHVPVDLSASATANCYIVSSAGSYYFKSVKGNSSTSVGTVSSVAVLWESFGTSTTPSVGDLIRSVSYIDGNIYFDMVFQDYNLFPHQSVLKNLTLPQTLVLKRSAKEAEAKARELLSKVGLSEKADAYPCNLSGGQCQRVAIARALCMDPDILCFDEPTSALDPQLTHEVLSVIRQLSDENRTMIVVTHEMNFARDVADRVIYMENGLVVEDGPAQEVLGANRSEAIKAFAGEANY